MKRDGIDLMFFCPVYSMFVSPECTSNNYRFSATKNKIKPTQGERTWPPAGCLVEAEKRFSTTRNHPKPPKTRSVCTRTTASYFRQVFLTFYPFRKFHAAVAGKEVFHPREYEIFFSPVFMLGYLCFRLRSTVFFFQYKHLVLG